MQYIITMLAMQVNYHWKIHNFHLLCSSNSIEYTTPRLPYMYVSMKLFARRSDHGKCTAKCRLLMFTRMFHVNDFHRGNLVMKINQTMSSINV